MILISAGIPKSGSTLLMVYSIELLSMEYGNKGQIAFQNWVQDGPAKGIENYPGENWTEYFDDLENIAVENGPFVLKTHKSCSQLQSIIENQDVKVIFSYRDPRDIVLSAIDHGTRSRKLNEPIFAEFISIETTVPAVAGWCDSGLDWMYANKVHRIRYEHLVHDPLKQVLALGEFLGITNPFEKAVEVIRKERMNRKPIQNQFNKGLETRYAKEMNPIDIQFCDKLLGKYIRAFGY